MRSVCTEQKVTQKENSKKWFLHNFDVYPGWYAQEVVSSLNSSPHCLPPEKNCYLYLIPQVTQHGFSQSSNSRKVNCGSGSVLVSWSATEGSKSNKMSTTLHHKLALFSTQRPCGTGHRLEQEQVIKEIRCLTEQVSSTGFLWAPCNKCWGLNSFLFQIDRIHFNRIHSFFHSVTNMRDMYVTSNNFNLQIPKNTLLTFFLQDVGMILSSSEYTEQQQKALPVPQE